MLETFKMDWHTKPTVLGNTLSDTDNKGDLGLKGLLNTGGGQRRTGKLLGCFVELNVLLRRTGRKDR